MFRSVKYQASKERIEKDFWIGTIMFQGELVVVKDEYPSQSRDKSLSSGSLHFQETSKGLKPLAFTPLIESTDPVTLLKSRRYRFTTDNEGKT